jgi:hypothetical protein
MKRRRRRVCAENGEFLLSRCRRGDERNAKRIERRAGVDDECAKRYRRGSLLCVVHARMNE